MTLKVVRCSAPATQGVSPLTGASCPGSDSGSELDHNHRAHPLTSQAAPSPRHTRVHTFLVWSVDCLHAAISLRHLYSGTPDQLQSPVTAELRIDPWCPLAPPLTIPGFAGLPTLLQTLTVSNLAPTVSVYPGTRALLQLRRSSTMSQVLQTFNIFLTILRHHHANSMTMKKKCRSVKLFSTIEPL